MKLGHKIEKFNGHRSWNAWAVNLWLTNDENLYALCEQKVRQFDNKKAAARAILQLLPKYTPEGAKYNLMSVYATIKDWQ